MPGGTQGASAAESALGVGRRADPNDEPRHRERLHRGDAVDVAQSVEGSDRGLQFGHSSEGHGRSAN